MKKQKFETALMRLEEITRLLEGKELELEQSLKLYQEGVGLYQQCHGMLNDAEKKITTIIDADGNIKPLPFEPEEEE